MNGEGNRTTCLDGVLTKSEAHQAEGQKTKPNFGDKKGGIIMDRNIWKKKIVYFLLGALSVLSFLFLTGANDFQEIGRYQISTVVKRGFVENYVIDTTTGAIKYVSDKNENKPFSDI